MCLSALTTAAGSGNKWARYPSMGTARVLYACTATDGGSSNRANFTCPLQELACSLCPQLVSSRGAQPRPEVLRGRPDVDLGPLGDGLGQPFFQPCDLVGREGSEEHDVAHRYVTWVRPPEEGVRFGFGI